MKKSDIVDRVAAATGLTKLETEAVVDGLLLTIVDALKRGENVDFRGFGSFRVKRRAPRMARNPKSGHSVRVPEQHVPVFAVARGVRRQIDDAYRTRTMLQDL
ncbi:MAG: HU family DNA-binding protein [Rhodothermia bacterium]